MCLISQLCIPKYSALGKEDIIKEDVMEHVIIPESDEGEDYQTWNKQVNVVSKC